MKRLEPLLKPRGAGGGDIRYSPTGRLPAYRYSGGVFSFFACFHPLPLPLLVLWCHRESVFKIILGFQIKGDQMDVKSRQLNAVCDL